MTDSLEKAREIADSFLMDLTARHCESWVGDPMSYSEGKEILSSKIAAALAEAREEGIKYAQVAQYRDRNDEAVKAYADGRRAGLEEAAKILDNVFGRDSEWGKQIRSLQEPKG